MVTSASLDAVPYPTPPKAAPTAATSGEAPTFEALYEQQFDFVWRNIRRLGVPDAQVDDAVQEVFLVVHRRLVELEARSSFKNWIFGIIVRVARDHRRLLRRKSPHTRSADASVDADSIADDRADNPHDRMARSEGVRLLHKLLDEFDDEKRAVFVLAELEQMSAPEIADALDVNVNTVYARLRAARREFEQAVLREQARDTWRLR